MDICLVRSNDLERRHLKWINGTLNPLEATNSRPVERRKVTRRGHSIGMSHGNVAGVLKLRFDLTSEAAGGVHSGVLASPELPAVVPERRGIWPS